MSWPEPETPRDYKSIVVGGGPGGLGPLLWAAQNGLIDTWLARGVALLDSSDRLGGSLGQYGINSDSLGASYLECLDAPNLPEPLRQVRFDPVTAEIERFRGGFPPLSLVHRYMERIGHALVDVFRPHAASAIGFNTTALSLHQSGDGRMAVLVQDGNGEQTTLTADSVVVALGGRQPWKAQVAQLGLVNDDYLAEHLLPSNVLLTHDGLARADALMAGARGRPIVILGGSHSAYATAQALLQLPAAATLDRGQIVVLQRRAPKVFYPDGAHADADGYAYEAGDLCQRTQRVNRMGGLRGYGRDVWRQIHRKPGVDVEQRVVVLDVSGLTADTVRDLFQSAALTVPCLGYRSRTLPVYDSDGQRLRLNAEEDADAVGDDCRLLLADGGSLPNVFGIGLGCGFRPSEAMGCEPNFRGQANSLWLYQNDIGGAIYRAIHADEMLPPAATPASTFSVGDR